MARPVAENRWLFEKLSLEGFQAGLSWLTIIRKREQFHDVFARFDPAAVARFGAKQVNGLLVDPAWSATGPRSRRPSTMPTPMAS